MTHHYSSIYAYRSKFDPLKIFATSEEARAFDRGWVAQMIGLMTHDDIRTAIADGNPGLKDVLRFLVDEIPDVLLERVAS